MPKSAIIAKCGLWFFWKVPKEINQHAQGGWYNPILEVHLMVSIS